MRNLARSATPLLTALLAAGALAGGLQPAAASANAATRVERAAARATRTAEREARREARQRERDERREARELARAGKSDSPISGAPGASAGEPTPTGEGGAPTGEAGTPSGESALTTCRPTLQTSAGHILAGETVTITGTLTCSDRASAAAAQVTISLDERSADAAAASPSTPSTLGPVTTAADGSFEVVSPALQRTTVFRVKLGKHGARAIVKVAPAVTLSAPTSATLSSLTPVAPTTSTAPTTPTTPAEPTAHGDTLSRVTFTGTVAPAEPGSRIALQVAYATEGGQWRTVAFARVAADGSYAVAHRFRKAGTASVRVIAHMHGRNVNGISPVLAYEVVQAQKPQRPARPGTPQTPKSEAPLSQAPASQTPVSPAS